MIRHPLADALYLPAESRDFGSVEGAIRVDLPIDNAWRKACKAKLREMGRDQYELADHVGCSQSNISQAWSEKKSQRTSEFAHAISLALGVDLPMEARSVLVAYRARDVNPQAYGKMIEGLEAQYGIPPVKPV